MRPRPPIRPNTAQLLLCQDGPANAGSGDYRNRHEPRQSRPPGYRHRGDHRPQWARTSVLGGFAKTRRRSSLPGEAGWRPAMLRLGPQGACGQRAPLSRRARTTCSVSWRRSAVSRRFGLLSYRQRLPRFFDDDQGRRRFSQDQRRSSAVGQRRRCRCRQRPRVSLNANVRQQLRDRLHYRPAILHRDRALPNHSRPALDTDGPPIANCHPAVANYIAFNGSMMRDLAVEFLSLAGALARRSRGC
jgi:hypothetical protein